MMATRMGPYDTEEAYSQARDERYRLAAVAYLRAVGGIASVGQIAKHIGAAPQSLGRIIDKSPRTFRGERHNNGRGWSAHMIELHPHLMVA